MMRRGWLMGIAGGCTLLAAIVGASYYASQPSTLTVAVGPPGSDDARLVAAIARQLGRDQAPLRWRVVEKPRLSDGALALDKGEVDLAIVRRDRVMPKTGQAVTIWRKNVVAIMAAPDAGIETVTDLAGRRVGVVGRTEANFKLLEAILAQYDMRPEAVSVSAIDGDEISPAVGQAGLEALVVAGPATGRVFADAVTAMTRNGRGPNFLSIGEAQAIAQRVPAYEPAAIVAGSFGSSKPAENVPSIGFSHYVMARKDLDEGTVGEAARLLLGARVSLASEFPGAARIQAPSTDKDAAIPVHPGAAAFYDGDQKTFFDRYGDLVYWAVMLLSGVGSAAAAMVTYTHAGDRRRRTAQIEHLLQLMRAARSADSPKRLDEIQAEADEILAQAVRQVERRHVDQSALTAYSMALDQVRRAISDRRAALTDGWRRSDAHSGPLRPSAA